jgi:hypothetical protein
MIFMNILIFNKINRLQIFQLHLKLALTVCLKFKELLGHLWVCYGWNGRE